MSRDAYWETVGKDWAGRRPFLLWRMHSDAVNARLLEDWLPPSAEGKLLKTDTFDEAVAQGLAPVLGRYCGEIVAMDIATATLRAARPKLGEQLARADARSLPFASGSFATVVSLSTLDHFENEAELMVSLAELRRVCSPGGRLVLTLDNPTNPLIWLRGALPYSWLSRTGIVPYFVGANLDARRLSSALRSLGFEIEAQKALVHVPRVLAIAACRALERSRSLRLRRAWLALLMRFEALERWPTRFVTGHFVAIRARTPRA